MLYPIDSETRQTKDLNGIWDFALDPENIGVSQAWFSQSRLPGEPATMPVPASYNDITTDKTIRDHIGPAWYLKKFFAPKSWESEQVDLRVGAASHRAVAWINGVEICRHKGGFLPFEGEASSAIRYGEENTLIIQVDNILDWTTLPPGEVKFETARVPSPVGFKHQDYMHDFYNFSGLHRPVRLVVRPRNGVEDVTVKTTGDSSVFKVSVHTVTNAESVSIALKDDSGVIVAQGLGINSVLTVESPNLWQPGAAYLYNLEVSTIDESGAVYDVYHLPIGLRTVEVIGKQFLINGEPFYFRGFGKHEDADIRGKGLDEVTNARDFQLLKWINANSFRTSHYPYAEEMMRMADREGIVVIDEVPAVGLYFFTEDELPEKSIFVDERAGEPLRSHHLDCVREMIQRDKNHPCVVMWSLGNETATHEDAGVTHYEAVASLARSLDDTRPLTIVEYNFPWYSKIGHIVDVLGVNRYYGWYFDTGCLETIAVKLRNEIECWWERWQKPVLFTEYGADTIEGTHALPATMFSEEFQIEFLDQYHTIFDEYDYVIGEQVWAFADFATKEGVRRVGGNKKGIFTRQRQPKSAAHYLRKRWEQLREKQTR